MTTGSTVKRIVMFAAMVLTGVATMAGPVAAQEDSSVSAEQELVEKYAPIMMLKAQEASCDPNGEPYAPQSVELILGNRDVVLRQVGNQNPVVAQAPTAADLYGRGGGFFLDFPGSALAPGCIYEQDFDRYSNSVTGERTPVVYAHIATQADAPDKLAVQYWFYWYFNDWNNKHESDWEGIQLLFDVGTVDEALRTEPTSAGYAQHEGGEIADWNSSKLDRDGDRPVVYSSSGSHASYYGSALYLGRGASTGFGCDTTDGPSVRTDPSVVLLPSVASGPADEFAWLGFDGRWGERQGGSFNGPTGPSSKQRWSHPVDWHDDLRSASVVVPAGDNQGDVIVSSFCGIVEVGSGVLVMLQTSPLSLLAALAVAFIIARWLIGRTVWTSVSPIPLVARRRAGEIIRAAAGSYRRHARLLITIGMLYLPAAIAAGMLAALLRAVPLLRDLTESSGSSSATGVLFALLAGTLANSATFVAVNAVVTAYYVLLADDADASARDAAKVAWSHARALAGGFLWSFLIVSVLLLSFVGIPVALWLLVRFQFLAQAVVTECHDGRGALRRSGQLVTGRWWHTALMIGLINLLVGLSGMLVGLLLLVVAAGIPLWLFSALISLVYALIVPLAAVGLTLLFGDAAAEKSGAEAEDQIVDDDLVPA